jgi:hypothetical protein
MRRVSMRRESRRVSMRDRLVDSTADFFFLILHAGSLARWKGPDYQTSGTRIPQACGAHLQATIYQTCKVCSKTELKLLPHVPSHCVQNLLMIINQCKVC